MKEISTKPALILEISGEKGDIGKYQMALCEAYLLGINKVMFCCIWDNNQERGESIFNDLKHNLELLDMQLIPAVLAYGETMFQQPVVAQVDDKDRMVDLFSCSIPLDEYKVIKSKSINSKEVNKVLKKLV